MTIVDLAPRLQQALLALGALFVIVNVRVAWQIGQWFRRRRSAVLVWSSPKPRYYAVNLAIGVMLGILVFVDVSLLVFAAQQAQVPFADLFDEPAVARQVNSVFGVGMMFLYYGYLLPLSTRIAHGLYDDGIWADNGFMRYVDIGGLSWKADDTLILASRQRTFARLLTVPGPKLGEVRRMLREKISAHAIEFEGGPGLHLGSRDTRESV
jgi:hypothetical protein